MTFQHRCSKCSINPVHGFNAKCPSCLNTEAVREQIEASEKLYQKQKNDIESRARDEQYKRESDARSAERANNPSPYVPWRGWPDFILRVLVISPGVFLVGYFWYWLVCG